MLIVIAIGIFFFFNIKYWAIGRIQLWTKKPKIAGAQPSHLTNNMFVSRIVLKESQAPEQENIIIKKIKGFSQ